MVYDTNSDGFELKFPDLSQAELKGCQAEPTISSFVCQQATNWYIILSFSNLFLFLKRIDQKKCNRNLARFWPIFDFELN